MSILPSLFVALALTQTAPSRDELAGASIVLRQAADNLGAIVITNPTPHRACLSPPSNTIPVGAVTIRVGVVILSQAGQRALFNDGDGDTYAMAEIQAAPSTDPFARPPQAIDFLDDTEIEKRATPAFPTDGAGRNCQISAVRVGFASIPWRCACAATPATCTWTGGPTTKDRTLAPGTWSGAGCVPKVCVERFGSGSMPAVCQ